MPPRPSKVREGIAKTIVALRDLKNIIKTAEAEIKGDPDNDVLGVEAIVIRDLEEREQKSITVEDDNGVKITATIVAGSSEVINVDMLKKTLGAAAWNKITSTVLDRKKLEDAMARKDIDPLIVAQCSETVPKKPYVKISENTAKAVTPTVKRGKAKSDAARKVFK